jgi:acyl-[acyl-carrier-protein]-phospholipid O-acyltransferase/long-chain-fatty-acid--[acyl-carrier-protein] ligase
MFSSKKKHFNLPFPFNRKGDHSLAMLNTTQFLGVVNDNIFKLVMSYLLIDTLGKALASPILSATGAIYVIPFLLFSSFAGILADRFSKQKLLIIMKIVEMAIMVLAFFAFAHVSVIGCYALLFLLSTHSAMFGPSKYGIIPELVTSDMISRANGIVTAFTYLAMILGTFLASFLTDVTGRRFTWIIVFCFLVALAGFFSSLGIKQTPAQDSEKKMNLFFIKEIYKSLKASFKIRHLLPAICGSAFFLFIGGFTQLNIIPYAMQCLNLSEVAGGYLFLVTAVGIALGSYLAGKASKKRVELGLSCIAGIIISIFFFVMGVCAEHLIKAIVSLLFIGIFGGIFIVPFETFIQVNSPDRQRGQMIAAGNFLSFFGVLIASALVYVFPKFLSLSPAGGFAVIGGFSLLFTFLQMFWVSDLFLHFLSRTVLHRRYRFQAPDIETIEKGKNTILVLEKATWNNALLLLGTFPNIHLIIPASHPQCIRWFHRLFFSFHIISDEANVEELVQCAQSILEKGDTPCLFLERSFPKKNIPISNAFLDFFQKKSCQLLFATFERDPHTRRQVLLLSNES